jgi:hypothetical protein
VAGAVDEVFPIPGLLDHAPGRRVNILGFDAWLDGIMKNHNPAALTSETNCGII